MPNRLKNKQNNRNYLRAEHFVFYVVAALFITLVWWLGDLNFANHKNTGGSSSLSPTSSQLYYKSLDLSLVKKAEFNSQAIKQDKNTGTIRNVRHFIFSFGVPHDNLTEHGLMTLPTKPAPADGYPVLVLCHGYVNPWNYSTQRSYLTDMEAYSRQGFAVVKPDLRGQGLSISAGQPEGAYYTMAYNTDVMSLIAAVKSTNYLNKNDINIWGHSMGAYVALRAAVVSKDIKNAILLAGPVGSFKDMFSGYIAVSDTANPTAATIRLKQLDLHGTPVGNPAFWDKASPSSYINDTSTHFQIHVGTLDSIVPPQFSADFDAALTASGKKHEYYQYAGAGHGLLAQRTLIWQRSLDTMRH